MADDYFPDKRDVLVVRVKYPTDNLEFYVMAVHAKSRFGGRATTDPRRIAAARIMVQKLKAGYPGNPFVLLGDFNDNPDDESMNILETATWPVKTESEPAADVRVEIFILASMKRFHFYPFHRQAIFVSTVFHDEPKSAKVHFYRCHIFTEMQKLNT